jgi:hypothetical protein
MSLVTVTTTPTPLCTAKVARLRSWLTFEVVAGGQRVFVGRFSNVSIQTGNAIEPTPSNASTLFASGKPAEDAWYAVVASGEQVVSVQEGGGAELSRGNDSIITIMRPGKSAYDLAVDKGFTGTEEEWVASLQVSEPLPADILRGTVDGDGVMVAITDRDGTPITEVPYVP